VEKLRAIVEETDTPAGKAFDLFTIGMIVFSLLLFPFETVPELAVYEDFFQLVERVTIAIFTVEYLLRLVVTRRKLRYVFSFYGIIDLLAILPFFLFGGVDLRVVRIFRLARLLRVFKLTRYLVAVRRLRAAFREIREELTLYFAATLLVLYIASVGIYYFENEAQPEVFTSVLESMWWALATLTTVGYGDMYPVTAGGRLFTFVILLFGLGVVAIPSALMASALTRKDKVDDSLD
jgi:voltage-gated potassium channel